MHSQSATLDLNLGLLNITRPPGYSYIYYSIYTHTSSSLLETITEIMLTYCISTQYTSCAAVENETKKRAFSPHFGGYQNSAVQHASHPLSCIILIQQEGLSCVLCSAAYYIFVLTAAQFFVPNRLVYNESCICTLRC